MTEPRYQVGCPGMLVLGTEQYFDDELDALAACLAGPVGSEVYDRQTKQYIGPYCQEDADEIKKRLEERRSTDG